MNGARTNQASGQSEIRGVASQSRSPERIAPRSPMRNGRGDAGVVWDCREAGESVIISLVGSVSVTLLFYLKGSEFKMVEENNLTYEPETEKVQTDERRQVMRALRHVAKRRKRIIAWMNPLLYSGIALTLFIGVRSDTRLSIAIFCSTVAAVLGSYFSGLCQMSRLAQRAAELCDIRAIGPLLMLLHNGEDSASSTIEAALITLLPAVAHTNQLSREARKGLASLLMREETGRTATGSRYNVQLIHTALKTVGRLQDCYALPAVRRLAEGYGPIQPVAEIRDLAQDILPCLEKHSLLLRPAMLEQPDGKILLRAVSPTRDETSEEELLRPVESETADSPARRSYLCKAEERPECLPLSGRS